MSDLYIEFCTRTVTVNIPRITAGKPAVTESQICKNPLLPDLNKMMMMNDGDGIKCCGITAITGLKFAENPRAL